MKKPHGHSRFIVKKKTVIMTTAGDGKDKYDDPDPIDPIDPLDPTADHPAGDDPEGDGADAADDTVETTVTTMTETQFRAKVRHRADEVDKILKRGFEHDHHHPLTMETRRKLQEELEMERHALRDRDALLKLRQDMEAQEHAGKHAHFENVNFHSQFLGTALATATPAAKPAHISTGSGHVPSVKPLGPG